MDGVLLKHWNHHALGKKTVTEAHAKASKVTVLLLCLAHLGTNAGLCDSCHHWCLAQNHHSRVPLQTQFWYLFEGSQMKSSSSQGLKMKHACNHQLAISSDIWDCPCLLSVRRQTKVAVAPWSSSCFENESIKWSSPPRIPDLMVFQFCLSQMKPIITNYTTFHDIRKCLNGLLMIWNSGCQQTFFSLQW